jgi:formamidopyrimidine-DNA glycosylase
MPELPDVEVARRRLERALVGGAIRAARSTDRRILRPRTPRAFAASLVGRTVREVSRRGKWLRIALDDGGRLFSHLGMTGWWVELEVDSPARPSERARIDVVKEGGRTSSARYLDARRFGRLIAARDDIEEWRTLGPDPLIEGIDTAALAAALVRRRGPIKDALMDQSIVAGIGNILATEALWHARIDPRSRSGALARADVARLARGLRTAIGRELATRRSWRGDADDWQDVFEVYGHAGAACPRCGAPIARTVIGGRTTAFCRRCQIRLR